MAQESNGAIVDPTEQALGILAYRSPLVPGFSAVSKARYSDFCVHEVGVDGSIARLESMEPRVATDDGTAVATGSKDDDNDEPAQEQPQKDDDDKTDRKRKRETIDDGQQVTGELTAMAASKAPAAKVDWSQLETELKAFIGNDSEDTAKKTISFLQRIQDGKSSNNGEQHFAKLAPVNDKQKRRELHHWVRSSLSFCAKADTIDDGDDKIVRIWHVSFEKKMPKLFDRGAGASRGPRPPAGKKYLQFVLYKENTDTTAAIKEIQRRCGGGGRGGRGGGRHGNQRDQVRIGYAGNKDKRGITSQFATVPATTRIASLCSWNRPGKGGGHTRDAGVSVIRLGNFTYAADEVRLGRLLGNRFDVALRNVQTGSDRAAAKAHLEKAANAIREHGFINYFGVQRFGKFHDTHLTGIAVLKGDFEKAVDIIMQVKEGEREQAQKLREAWKERFQTTTNDNRAALEKEWASKLARQFHRSMTAEVALMQSLARFPLDYKRAFSCIPKTLRMMFVHAMQSYLWNLVASHRMQMPDGDRIQPGDLVLEDATRNGYDDGVPTVRVVSDQEVASGRYTLEDVVLPLVGTKTRYPENECGNLFVKLLNEQGVTLDMMKNVHDKDLVCVGDYRKLLCRPTDVDYTIVEYTDPLQPLLQTDLMRLNGIKVETVVGDDKDGGKDPLLGLVVGFSLPSSSYATIFVRELMKRPTSGEFQGELKLE